MDDGGSIDVAMDEGHRADKGLEMLVKGCVNLESVDVSHCCEFGDRECDAISFGAGLKEIKLDKCLGVTDVGLAKIAIR
nr:F-box/LRR-repeat protein 3 [Tanacetum cinerariifolium]GFA52510.1 F-box/LRR-repeat protein 3 [Tanacetum cinerariifolium]